MHLAQIISFIATLSGLALAAPPQAGPATQPATTPSFVRNPHHLAILFKSPLTPVEFEQLEKDFEEFKTDFGKEYKDDFSPDEIKWSDFVSYQPPGTSYYWQKEVTTTLRLPPPTDLKSVGTWLKSREGSPKVESVEDKVASKDTNCIRLVFPKWDAKQWNVIRINIRDKFQHLKDPNSIERPQSKAKPPTVTIQHPRGHLDEVGNFVKVRDGPLKAVEWKYCDDI